MRYLVDSYQGEGVPSFTRRFKLGLKDVVLILVLKLVNLGVMPNSIKETSQR